MQTERKTPLIDLKGVSKSFGTHRVLESVDLKVHSGQVLGLLGRNGAGKSTLIDIMCGMLAADAGKVSICGCNPASRPARKLIGCAPQDIGVYPDLTVRQNLACYGAIEGLSRRKSLERAQEVMKLLGIEEQARQNARSLSGGQRRRLHAGMAIMHKPRVVFMDEPTVGADVEARSRLLKTVRALADEGAAVVYTSHYLAEFEELGADIAVLNDGRIVASGTLDGIVRKHARASVVVKFAGSSPAIPGWKAAAEGIQPVEEPTDPSRAIADLLANPAARGLKVDDIRIEKANLQSAYLAIIGEKEVDDAA